jgi:AcrR family transcriptional regulator
MAITSATSAPRKAQKSQKAHYHKGLSRDEILEVALDVLREGSLDSLTLARVAQRLGVSAPAVYQYFPNKEALLAAAAAAGFRRLIGIYQQAGREQTELNGWIRARGRAFLQFALDEPALHQLMYRYRFADRHAYPDLIEAEDACFATSVARIGDGSGRRPQFRSPQSARDFPVSMTIWAAFHGLASIIADGVDGHRRMPDKQTIEKLAADVADVLTQKIQVKLLPPED